MIKLHKYCKTQNLAHRVIFSGKGFHVYILVNINKENTILDVLHYQSKLMNNLSLNVDLSCIGTHRHMIRIPGTFNLRRNRWCISLKESELTSYEEISNLAINQRNEIYIIKGNNLDLPHSNSSHTKIEPRKYTDLELKDISFEYYNITPCLRTNIIPNGHIPHMERVYLTLYLSEFYRGGKSVNELTQEEFNIIVEKIVRFFEPIVFDFDERYTRNTVTNIVRKHEYSTSCKKLQELGLCVSDVYCWRR